jgi:hypothetical protein
MLGVGNVLPVEGIGVTAIGVTAIGVTAVGGNYYRGDCCGSDCCWNEAWGFWGYTLCLLAMGMLK